MPDTDIPPVRARFQYFWVPSVLWTVVWYGVLISYFVAAPADTPVVLASKASPYFLFVCYTFMAALIVSSSIDLRIRLYQYSPKIVLYGFIMAVCAQVLLVAVELMAVVKYTRQLETDSMAFLLIANPFVFIEWFLVLSKSPLVSGYVVAQSIYYIILLALFFASFINIWFEWMFFLWFPAHGVACGLLFSRRIIDANKPLNLA